MCKRRANEVTCECGCRSDSALEVFYDNLVAELRDEVSSLAERSARVHEIAHCCKCDAPAVLFDRLAYMADHLMRSADHEKCRRKSAVHAMTTACILEVASYLGVPRRQNERHVGFNEE